MTAFLRLAFVLLVIAHARDGEACQCIGSPNVPPCQSFFDSTAVFAGTVRSIGPNPSPRPARPQGPYQDLHIEFVDVEPFRGVKGSTLHVLTSGGQSSCGYGFKVGERYVVYGRETTQGIEVTMCSETKLASDAADDLIFLRIPGMARSGAPVYGTVTHAGTNGEPRPLGNVSMVLRSADARLETRTDERGRFTFDGVRLGSYTLTAIPPTGFSEAFPRVHHVNLPQLRACYRADFSVESAQR